MVPLYVLPHATGIGIGIDRIENDGRGGGGGGGDCVVLCHASKYGVDHAFHKLSLSLGGLVRGAPFSGTFDTDDTAGTGSGGAGADDRQSSLVDSRFCGWLEAGFVSGDRDQTRFSGPRVICPDPVNPRGWYLADRYSVDILMARKISLR